MKKNATIMYERETETMKLYLQDVRRYDIPTEQEEHELIMRYRAGDQLARNELVARDLRLVITIANSLNNGLIPLKDMIQEGNMGLMAACETFDASMCVPFHVYCQMQIRRAILEAIGSQSRGIYVPRSASDEYDEIDEELEQDVELMQHVSARYSLPTTCSLSGKYSGDEDGLCYEDVVTAESCCNADYSMMQECKRKDIRAMLNRLLSDKEAQAMSLKYGLDGREMMLWEVAETLGLTETRVRQLLASAGRKLSGCRKAHDLYAA